MGLVFWESIFSGSLVFSVREWGGACLKGQGANLTASTFCCIQLAQRSTLLTSHLYKFALPGLGRQVTPRACLLPSATPTMPRNAMK